jgi:hypothetical protein
VITTIVTPLALEALADDLLPRPRRRLLGVDRSYRVYRSNLTCDLRDLDGTSLVEARVFDTEGDAVRWVEEDARQRRWLHSAKVLV